MNETSDEVVRKIKSKITKARQDGEYETKVFSYLLVGAGVDFELLTIH